MWGDEVHALYDHGFSNMIKMVFFCAKVPFPGLESPSLLLMPRHNMYFKACGF